ncbi:MAG: hypothetical protein ABSF50_16185 [Burkholderiaceae bacterium]|jgi:hypothetical protein
MTRFWKFFAGLALGASVSMVCAQQPAATFDPNSVTVPPAPCEQPPTKPVFHATPNDSKRFNERANAYRKCMTDYWTGLEGTAKNYEEAAKKYIDAGNAAIKTFNDYAAEVRKNMDEDQ